MIKPVFKKVSAIAKFIFKTAVIIVFLGSFFVNGILLFSKAGAFFIDSAIHAATGFSTVSHRLHAKKIQQEGAIRKIASNISKRTARGATRNVLTMPAEALPFAGVAVVVGITALEIKDACDTMRDLDKLNQLIGDNASGAKAPGEKTSVSKVCGIAIPSVADVRKKVEKAPNSSLEKAKEWGIEGPDLDNKLQDRPDKIEIAE